MSLEGKKLYVATPCYGGMVTTAFMSSMLSLMEISIRVGVPIQFGFIYNESLITRGRNKLVSMFLETDCTHLIFLDADIQFDPNDVIALLRLDKDVIGGGYSKKAIRWERVAQAAKAGVPPEKLAEQGTNPCFNLMRANGSVSLWEPLELPELGTGYMMIKRSVFETIKDAHPDKFYHDDVDGSGKKIHNFFDCVVRDGRYLSEDYAFCRMWGDLGGKVLVCPWMKTTHFGTYGFGLDLQAVADAGVSL